MALVEALHQAQVAQQNNVHVKRSISLNDALSIINTTLSEFGKINPQWEKDTLQLRGTNGAYEPRGCKSTLVKPKAARPTLRKLTQGLIKKDDERWLDTIQPQHARLAKTVRNIYSSGNKKVMQSIIINHALPSHFPQDIRERQETSTIIWCKGEEDIRGCQIIHPTIQLDEDHPEYYEPEHRWSAMSQVFNEALDGTKSKAERLDKALECYWRISHSLDFPEGTATFANVILAFLLAENGIERHCVKPELDINIIALTSAKDEFIQGWKSGQYWDDTITPELIMAWQEMTMDDKTHPATSRI